MSAVVLGGIAAVGIIWKLKTRIDEQERKIELLNAKNNDLSTENRRLTSTISRKDVEIKKLQSELQELKKSEK